MHPSINLATGDKCGAIFIDQAFLEWLSERMENLDISPEDFGTGGHMMLRPKGKILLDRFEKVKHAFDGEQAGKITLMSDAIVVPGYENEVVNGVLELNKCDFSI